MEWKNEQEQPVKVVFRRSPVAARVAVLVVLLVCTALLVTLSFMTAEARQKAAALKQQAAELEQQNAALEERIDGLNTLEGIEQIAKEELGLVDPDTIIFDTERQD